MTSLLWRRICLEFRNVHQASLIDLESNEGDSQNGKILKVVESFAGIIYSFYTFACRVSLIDYMGTLNMLLLQ